MRRAIWAAGLALALGCADTTQERVRDYNQDGVHLYERGDYAQARESFQAALALQPEDAGLLFNVGQCYDRLGDAAKAEQFYHECLRRAPNHPACWHALVALLVRDGRRPEAEQLVVGWILREPKRSSPYAEDGWLYHQAGNLPLAQGRLTQALQIDPKDCRALTELALVYEEMQRPDRALSFYQTCLEVNPRQPDIVRRVAQLRAQGVGPPRPE